MFLTIFGSDSSGFDLISHILIAIPILGIYGLISFPIGLYCRTLMKTKGYDGSTGFFLGFLLSILGMLICALMPVNKAGTHYQPPYEPYGQPYQPYNQHVQEHTLDIRCTNCGALNPPNSVTCLQCGEKLI